jgi:beta-glucosidase
MNIDQLLNQMTLEELSGQLMHQVAPIPRLNLRGYCYWSEGLHGVARAGLATVFPQAIALASTFNPMLIKKMAKAIGIEARVKFNRAIKYANQVPIYQGLHLWSPVLNVFRDPRWGRGQETFGEDPLVIATMGIAYVEGIQTKLDGQHPLADATIKHAFVHSGPERDRKKFNAIIDEKDFHATYLKAFEMVIKKAKPSGIMMAYNAINGVPCVVNKDLITKIIKDRWHFDGYLVSDCQAVESVHQHHRYTQTMKQTVIQTIDAGINLTCGLNQVEMLSYLESGSKEVEEVKRLLKPLLLSRQRLGIDELNPPYAHFTEQELESKKHQQTNLKLAEESIVLLENNGLLPLQNKKFKLGVLGNNANNVDALLGNYHGRPSRSITPLDGFKVALNQTQIRYALGCEVGETKSWLEQPFNEALSVIEWAEILVLVLGIDSRYEGEENDALLSTINGDKVSLEYSQSQMKLIHAAIQSGKPVVLVNISGSPMIIPNLPFAAVIQQFYGGALAGKALANIISGRVAPSGKLPISFPHSMKELPPFENYDMTNRTYRYETKPSRYSFGYGLTYGQCQILSVDRIGNQFTVNIKNNANKILKQTLQIYWMPKHPDKILRELVFFKKITIKAGQIAVHRIRLFPRGKPEDNLTSRWVVSLNGPYDQEAINCE